MGHGFADLQRLYLDEPSADGSYPCKVIPTAKVNGLHPSVCQESRNLAKESGGILTRDAYKDLSSDAVFVSTTSNGIADDFWVDTKRHSAHLKWTPYYESIYQKSSGSALASLAWKSRLVISRPSIMSDWVAMMVDQKEDRFDVFEQIPSCRTNRFLWAARRRILANVSTSDEEKANALYDFADECDRKASSGEATQRNSSESSKQELKDCLERNMTFENISLKMHLAIMFRLCISKCDSRNEG
ncbi:uncharacterized protein N7503_007564 [Penicillium pulvis]|uniref:uncharacterized protein n=1 Tax=Penicillium pulvis TaxID=1562058 RepID=UPI0025482261|nr:uncharacterized protein N7503_007564 [Penicillium pulvis]KAJ5798268.1 hypothetical protein N7503_007564 [Penicillium pulvis]